KLEARLIRAIGVDLTRQQIRADPPEMLSDPRTRATAHEIMDQLAQLRARCQRYTGSMVTPMGDEMFYRYQESLIDELTTALAAVVQRSPKAAVAGEQPASRESSG